MKIFIQQDSKDCGPTCLRNIASYYGIECSMQQIRDLCYMTKEGVSLFGLSNGAKKLGFETITARITIKQLKNDIIFPCLLLLNNKHFVVVRKYSQWNKKYHILDPALGNVLYSEKELIEIWTQFDKKLGVVGVAMQLEPNGKILSQKVNTKVISTNLIDIIKIILPHKYTFLLIIVGTLLSMCLNLAMPFLSQIMIDIGIMEKQEKIIVNILFAQLIIVFSQMIIQYVQSWLALHTNTIINIDLISSYLFKLVSATNRLYDLKTRGDVLQRIGDYSRIKSFLMNNVVGIIFSTGTFILFSLILAIVNTKIFIILLIGYCLLAFWTFSFLHIRKILNYRKFDKVTQIQNSTIQFIEGITEIKLNNIERHLRWKWEGLQAQMYKLNIKELKTSQFQSLGCACIMNVTNILVSFICSDMVLNNNMSLGMMMSVSFIIGQLHGPLSSYISFVTSYQDAKISLDRLDDINSFLPKDDSCLYRNIDFKQDIVLDNISFSYDGNLKNYAIKNIKQTIPFGKVTAIIGNSGCGKSTILKLILGLYTPIEGEIFIGGQKIKDIDKKFWWTHVATVMQDGFIFSDSLLNNITLWDNCPNQELLNEAIRIANLFDCIEKLPAKLNTLIGKDGIGLSQGQKQRLLIARAAYMRSSFLFLDEPTSSLDKENEAHIIFNLLKYYKGRTVIIAIHELKYLKYVDNIIMLNNGNVIEQGNYNELKNKGYFINDSTPII